MKYSSSYLRHNEKKKSWQGFLRYKNEEGKWRQMGKTFPDTVKTERQAKKALQKWRNEMELEATRETAILPGADTDVGEYVGQFVDDLEASGNVERVTVSGYRTTEQRIREAFEGIKLRDLTSAHVQKWENGLTAKGLAPATVLKYHRLLSEACRHAVAVRDLTWNPCDAVKVPKQKSPSPNSLTAEGFARLAATFEIMGPSPVVTAASIALYTGLREGEVCGLHWKDYDSDSGTISVVEAIGKAKGGTYRKEPKSKSSRRVVPVSDQLARMLGRRREAMVNELEDARLKLSKGEFGELYIVGSIDGRYHAPASIGRGWKALSDAFELTGTRGRRITFHDLRNTDLSKIPTFRHNRWQSARGIAEGRDYLSVAASRHSARTR